MEYNSRKYIENKYFCKINSVLRNDLKVRKNTLNNICFSLKNTKHLRIIPMFYLKLFSYSKVICRILLEIKLKNICILHFLYIYL